MNTLTIHSDPLRTNNVLPSLSKRTNRSATPLVSIIVPIYNVQAYLEECLQSLAKQDYENLEILLIDDGSTDASGKICDRWASKDPRFVAIHQENVGLSAVLNRGIAQAQGDFCYFIDSDDYLINAQTISLLMREMRDDVDISMAAYFEKMEMTGKKRAGFYPKLGTGTAYLSPEQACLAIYDAKRYQYIFTVLHNKIYRKSLFTGIRYPDGKIHEDEYITYRLYLRARQIAFVQEVTYAYRIRPNSIIRSAYHPRKLVVFEALDQRLSDVQAFQNKKLNNKIKNQYFYNLVYHKLMLLKGSFPEYEEVKRRLQQFLQENPRFWLRPMFWKFKVKEWLWRWKQVKQKHCR